ncbi:hypothetical protein HELRODRAFT_161016 [Helobdella robusta]|uniref:Uncharacterized protein n=1 Tax=Helobdella robusta TaxID=6412 RepID=T1ER03_HELRO|nr:hypothetical protein HELRODRAFT_161016 [Helobdella robusta]ESO01840.1 hypothetical protein HELRODRAFT_161016 [Helobdella robusta]
MNGAKSFQIMTTAKGLLHQAAPTNHVSVTCQNVRGVPIGQNGITCSSASGGVKEHRPRNKGQVAAKNNFAGVKNIDDDDEDVDDNDIIVNGCEERNNNIERSFIDDDGKYKINIDDGDNNDDKDYSDDGSSSPSSSSLRNLIKAVDVDEVIKSDSNYFPDLLGVANDKTGGKIINNHNDNDFKLINNSNINNINDISNNNSNANNNTENSSNKKDHDKLGNKKCFNVSNVNETLPTDCPPNNMTTKIINRNFTTPLAWSVCQQFKGGTQQPVGGQLSQRRPNKPQPKLHCSAWWQTLATQLRKVLTFSFQNLKKQFEKSFRHGGKVFLLLLRHHLKQNCAQLINVNKFLIRVFNSLTIISLYCRYILSNNGDILFRSLLQRINNCIGRASVTLGRTPYPSVIKPQ